MIAVICGGRQEFVQWLDRNQGAGSAIAVYDDDSLTHACLHRLDAIVQDGGSRLSEDQIKSLVGRLKDPVERLEEKACPKTPTKEFLPLRRPDGIRANAHGHHLYETARRAFEETFHEYREFSPLDVELFILHALMSVSDKARGQQMNELLGMER